MFRREESNQPAHVKLPDSITLVYRNTPSVTPAQPSSQQGQWESVINMLANRGITVSIFVIDYFESRCICKSKNNFL